MTKAKDFLPVTRKEMQLRHWDGYDFLIVTGDAYVDHPSFGAAVIARVLEADGFRVAVLAQPAWQDASAFAAMGRPRLGAMVTSGNLDSMVAHYTAAKKRRSEDFYSPGKRAGLRPDRAVIVYSNRIRQAFPGLPLIIGGLEASLRRFAHYDYWDDQVRRCILADAKADLLVYGMGETATLAIARALKNGVPPGEIRDVPGTAYLAHDASVCRFPHVRCPSYEEVCASRSDYAKAAMLQYEEHDCVRGRAVLQVHGSRTLIVNPPARPLSTAEFDRVSELPYMRLPHPMYDAQGGVPAIEEVRFSIIHNRGCFGACNFCSLAFHQGRMVTCRSHASVVREAENMTREPDFKGYIHDVGGPTANFCHPSCKKQMKSGMCRSRNCLTPTPCPNLDADQSDYLALLRRLRQIPGIKKVFVRSGIRFDYLLEDKSGDFFAELVKYHISGQLKVAPEHCIDSVLDYMGKPHNCVYNAFMEKYFRLNSRYGKEQYLVPYLISSHPGSRLEDAVALAEYLKKNNKYPEQVQGFYPTPGTLSTCMYYTGIDPRTMKPVYVPRTADEKAMQRALLQWAKPQNRRLVLKALRLAGREDLIGYGKNCLVRPDSAGRPQDNSPREVRGKRTQVVKASEKRLSGPRRSAAAGQKKVEKQARRRPSSRGGR